MEKGYTNKEIITKLKYPYNDYYKSLLTRIRTNSNKQWKKISKNYNISKTNILRKYDSKFINQLCKLLEQGYSNKDVRKILNLKSDKKSVSNFKSLVYGIKYTGNYKDISSKYNIPLKNQK